jgi:tight adherence protein C
MRPVDFAGLIQRVDFLLSPPIFGVLVGVSAALIWLAIMPSRALKAVGDRLDDYLETTDVIQELELRQPFFRRVLTPVLRRVLGWLGRRMPLASIERTRRRLVQAGDPWGLTALDFLGLCLLLPIALGGGYFFLMGNSMPLLVAVRNSLILAVAGFLLPRLWLQTRVRRRQREIARALPDALDMLSIGVEAGLAFESALLRVGDQWSNALTDEFRRAVREMRLGTARDEALRNMADRAGVNSLSTFVAVLVQSTRLGVSIADVLRAQAAQMRLDRRHRAEEQARYATIRMIFPLVFLIFPAIFVVLLGPSAPALVGFFGTLTGSALPIR